MLKLAGIKKSFGGVQALRGARLEVRAGEVHGLVGENGAGKSTLINIATGLFGADEGTLFLEGQPVSFHHTRDALAHGVAVVHQEADLFAQLSIAENMLLGRGLVRGPLGLINWPGTYREADQLVESMGESFRVRSSAAGLPVARRMMAEIAVAVSEEVKVLFLDEPTASLTGREIDNLFSRIRVLRDAGVAIVYVSHRLEEILSLTDRVTIMRDGETVQTTETVDLTMETMVGAMVGRTLDQVFAKREVPIGEVLFEVKGLSARDGAFRDVSFEIRAGEIVGLYGFVGAGRTEVAQALFGMRPLSGGKVFVEGKDVVPRSARQALRAGVAYLPEDRLVQGIFGGHSLRANVSVASLPGLSRYGWLNRGAEHALTEEVMGAMQIRASSMEQTIQTLSGGNQQKVVFGRWRATGPKVFLLDEPTRGVDVGAKAEIHKLICDLAASGAAILMISSELPEVTAMSDRVVTMAGGRVTGAYDPRATSQEEIAAGAVPPSGIVEGEEHETSPGFLSRLLAVREIGIACFILALAGFMAVFGGDAFLTRDNFYDILAAAALPAIMAQGAMLIICAGGIDISVGSMMALTGAVAATAAKSGAPPMACLAIALALGVLFSLLNGGLSLSARIHPIIVTLAGISIYRGAMLLYTGNREVLQLPTAYRALSDGFIFDIPKVCFYVVAVTVAVHLFLTYTLPGRQVLALGNSENAARLNGFSKVRLTLLVFAISGFLVGLTSVLESAYYGGVQANTGKGMELKAIAAAVIGGTNILGGRGTALGTLLGAFLVSMLYSALVLLKISDYWQGFFVGGLILLAVCVDAVLQRAQERRA